MFFYFPKVFLYIRRFSLGFVMFLYVFAMCPCYFDKIGRVSTKSGLGLMFWLFIGRCLLLASMTLDIGFWPLTWLLIGSGLSWLRTLGFGSLALGHWSVTGVMGFMAYWCRPELYTYYYYTSILPIL